ncbi:TPA: AEC family transporter [Candidatus Bipolaricaulota bacterium]|nr:AEC family transporter [Candidatus Bipolaricaulota bacterium]
MATNVLVPVFTVVAAGWLLGWRLRLDPSPLAKLTFWILSPALIFESLRTAQLPLSSYGLVVAFVLAHYLGLYLLSLPLRNRLFPGDPPRQAAASLVLVFGNCGNLGLPVLLFSYGEAGFDVGVVFLATNTVLLVTLGVAIASWEGRGSWGKLAQGLLTVPWSYAVGAAALFRFALPLPPWIARATGLLSEGAIPALLLLLGLQLARVKVREIARDAAWLAILRLSLAGLLAWGLAAAFGLQGVMRGSLILEGSMPTAVNAFLLSAQFNRRPDLAAAALLLSTVLSLGTLTLTLSLLGLPG